jgi:hypothetical protein
MVLTTPVDTRHATKEVVQDVRVMNWETSVPEPTMFIYRTNTPAFPFCPVDSGEMCVVPPPLQTPVPVATNAPQFCNAAMLPGQICEWQDVPTVTPIPTVGGIWK